MDSKMPIAVLKLSIGSAQSNPPPLKPPTPTDSKYHLPLCLISPEPHIGAYNHSMPGTCSPDAEHLHGHQNGEISPNGFQDWRNQHHRQQDWVSFLDRVSFINYNFPQSSTNELLFGGLLVLTDPSISVSG